MKLDRKNKLLAGLIIAAAILIGKIFYIQIIDDSYKTDASNNSMVHAVIYPTRGIIYDRNGKILVGNKVAYDMLVTPKEVGEFDTLALCEILGVPPDFIRAKMQEYYRNRKKIGYRPVVMLTQLPPEIFMRFAEVAYKFPGFRGQARNIRDYPYNAGGNLLGYISEVSADDIKRNPEVYKAGDYIGKTGIEATCEKYLRGEKGYNIYLRNSRNRIETRYKDGEMDKEAIPGKDIELTLLHIPVRRQCLRKLAARSTVAQLIGFHLAQGFFVHYHPGNIGRVYCQRALLYALVKSQTTRLAINVQRNYRHFQPPGRTHQLLEIHGCLEQLIHRHRSHIVLHKAVLRACQPRRPRITQ